MITQSLMSIGYLREYVTQQLGLDGLTTINAPTINKNDVKISGYWIAQLRYSLFARPQNQIIVACVNSDKWDRGLLGIFANQGQPKIEHSAVCNLTDEHKIVEDVMHNIDIYPDDPSHIGLKNDALLDCTCVTHTGYTQTIITTSNSAKESKLRNLIYAVNATAHAIAKTTQDETLLDYMNYFPRVSNE